MVLAHLILVLANIAYLLAHTGHTVVLGMIPNSNATGITFSVWQSRIASVQAHASKADALLRSTLPPLLLFKV